MTSKQAFTDEEWARIRRAPLVAESAGGLQAAWSQNPLGDFRPRGGQQEAVASARALCHWAQLQLARQQVRRQRRQGQAVGPLAWFGVQGVIDHQVVRAVWTDGQLRCDRLLDAQARLLIDLGAESAATTHHVATRPASRPRQSRYCSPSSGPATWPQ